MRSFWWEYHAAGSTHMLSVYRLRQRAQHSQVVLAKGKVQGVGLILAKG